MKCVNVNDLDEEGVFYLQLSPSKLGCGFYIVTVCLKPKKPHKQQYHCLALFPHIPIQTCRIGICIVFSVFSFFRPSGPAEDTG